MTFKWVKGHGDNPNNHRVDRLAPERPHSPPTDSVHDVPAVVAQASVEFGLLPFEEV